MVEQSVTRGRGVYFGWRIVLALSLCSAGLVGVAISTFVMFAVPFTAEFGWSESQIGMLVSAMWLTGPLALVFGPVAARVGLWRMVIAGILVQSAALAAAQFVTSYAEMVTLRVVMGVGMALTVSAGPVIITNWFKRRFSTAMSIVWASAAVGQVVAAPLTVMLDEAYGWRTAALILAGVLAAIAAVALLLSRAAPSPEAMGVEGDDAASMPTAPAVASHFSALKSINWHAAVLMCLAVFGAGATSIALQSEAPILFSRIGMDQAAAAMLLSTFAGAAFVGTLLSGWLLDRRSLFSVSLVVSGSVMTAVLGLGLVLQSGGLFAAAAVMAIFGLGLGAGEILWVTLFQRQFGAAAFGATYGLFYCSFQLGMASGGPLGGLSLEHWGPMGFVLALAAGYAAPTAFGAWRPGKMAQA